jgi:hypothetical protein
VPTNAPNAGQRLIKTKYSQQQQTKKNFMICAAVSFCDLGKNRKEKF